jgi:predicted Zn finger-like uncharacterized protein
MTIRFSCPNCKKAFTVEDDRAGKRAKCHKCEQVITIPAPVAPPVDVEAFAAAALAEQPAAEPAAPATQIEIDCFYCGEKVKVNADLQGKQTPCPNPECRRIIKVPVLDKKELKDWRKAETRFPSGAKDAVQPAPEGTWGSRQATHVSRDALIEAAAIPVVREKLSWPQRIKRIGVACAAVLVVGLLVYGVSRLLTQNRGQRALKEALAAAAAGKDKNLRAELYRLAGDYALRTGQAQLAKEQFGIARSSAEDDWSRIDIAVSQVNFGSKDDLEITRGARLKWDDTNTQIRQTVQGIGSTEAFSEAMRRLTPLLLERGQDAVARALSHSKQTDVAEITALVGLELLRAKDEKAALEQATAAQTAYDGQPVKNSIPISLVALWLALGKTDKATALAPRPGTKSKPPVDPVVPAKEPQDEGSAAILGWVSGLALHGDWAAARKIANEAPTPEVRLAALVILGTLAADSDADNARKDVGEALDLVEAGNAKRPSPWDLYHLALLGARLGRTSDAPLVARAIPDAVLRGRAQLECFRRVLAENDGMMDATQLGQVDKGTPAYGLAVEALVRHNIRISGDRSADGIINSLEEAYKPFGQMGLALGIQDSAK